MKSLKRRSIRTAAALAAAVTMLAASLVSPPPAHAQNSSEWCFAWALDGSQSGLYGTDTGNTIVLPFDSSVACGDPAVATCFGWPATIVSNAAVVKGTPGFDVIVGGSADQTIHGGGGRDIICGGAGDDRIFGNTGRDLIDGGPGQDFIDGGNHDDSLYGGPGDDDLVGGAGHDTFVGLEGNDWIRGGTGDDVLVPVGTDHIADVVDGGAGDNRIGTVTSCYFDPDFSACVSPGTGRRW